MSRFKSILTAVLAAALLVGAGCGTTTTRSTGEVIDDSTLTTRVKTALVNEPGVKSTSINVQTFRGTVSLSGFVDSDEMARKAVSAAERVSGVRSVKNDMQVKPSS
jgi:hyperosmotically inducible protein